VAGSILPRHFGHWTLDMARVSYCFTYNNYTEDTIYELKLWINENCKYGCFQKEVAPTTGTQHLQGYFSLKKKKTMASIQKILVQRGISLALINANGTPTQNRQYCSKPGGQDFWESGDINIVGQGTRTDLSLACDKIKNKRPLSEVASDHPETFVKYHRGLAALEFTLDKPIDEREMEVVLLFGDAGTGKSHKAAMLAKLYGSYYRLGVPNGHSVWWDGYEGEKSVIIDEFKGWLTPTQLNTILDKYKLPLNIKGRTVYAKYEHVFITSNFGIDEWWSDKVIWNRQALLRRITSVYEYRGTDHVDSVIKKLK